MTTQSGKLTAAKERTKAAFIAPIDPAEIAVRLMEAGSQMKRPPGKSAREILAAIDPEMEAMVFRQAHAVMLYWKECIDNAQQPS